MQSSCILVFCHGYDLPASIRHLKPAMQWPMLSVSYMTCSGMLLVVLYLFHFITPPFQSQAIRSFTNVSIVNIYSTGLPNVNYSNIYQLRGNQHLAPTLSRLVIVLCFFLQTYTILFRNLFSR